MARSLLRVVVFMSTANLAKTVIQASLIFCAVSASGSNGTCEDKLLQLDGRSVQSQLMTKINSLIAQFSQIKTTISVDHDLEINVTGKLGYELIPVLNPNLFSKRVLLHVRSKGQLAIPGAQPADDWNIFRLKVSPKNDGTHYVDLVAHIGNWHSLGTQNIEIQALNMLVAISMVPYVRHVIVDIPVNDSNSFQTLRGISYDAIQRPRESGMTDLDILHQIDLLEVRLISEFLPVTVANAHFIGPWPGARNGSEPGDYIVDIFFTLTEGGGHQGWSR